jgi:hypothetical protein
MEGRVLTGLCRGVENFGTCHNNEYWDAKRTGIRMTSLVKSAVSLLDHSISAIPCLSVFIVSGCLWQHQLRVPRRRCVS